MAERGGSSKARRRAPTKRQIDALGDDGSLFSLRLPAIVRERPLDSFGILLAVAGAGMIVANATLLQTPLHQRSRAMDDIQAPVPRPTVSAPAAPATTAQTQAAPVMNPSVREAQAELGRRGFYDGPADGLMGPKTEAAIRAFETRSGLQQTGQTSPQLLNALRKQPVAPQPSERVAGVQRALNKLGFGPLQADGLMGDGTRTAIRRFEARRGLPQRGEITQAMVSELSAVSGMKLP
jgi:hypothetical protein